jgi:hypothetical protein
MSRNTRTGVYSKRERERQTSTFPGMTLHFFTVGRTEILVAPPHRVDGGPELTRAISRRQYAGYEKSLPGNLRRHQLRILQ